MRRLFVNCLYSGQRYQGMSENCDEHSNTLPHSTARFNNTCKKQESDMANWHIWFWNRNVNSHSEKMWLLTSSWVCCVVNQNAHTLMCQRTQRCNGPTLHDGRPVHHWSWSDYIQWALDVCFRGQAKLREGSRADGGECPKGLIWPTLMFIALWICFKKKRLLDNMDSI